MYIYIYFFFQDLSRRSRSILYNLKISTEVNPGQNSDNLQNLSGTNKIRAQDLSTRFVSSEHKL